MKTVGLTLGKLCTGDPTPPDMTTLEPEAKNGGHLDRLNQEPCTPGIQTWNSGIQPPLHILAIDQWDCISLKDLPSLQNPNAGTVLF
ncbi:hypothetical protein DSO57_1018866 [Entomophthora muscae]|uniref:Uncharacterized protein n=1 Tax=Entomophthora muscae TaxID=34485 RepID=A0ACC2RIP5_9FUNG|nr:hypothetical protein DSO57_1018866 [Entomophthora muscae]